VGLVPRPEPLVTSLVKQAWFTDLPESVHKRIGRKANHGRGRQ